MNVSIKNSFGKTSLGEIKELENHIKSTLPQSYKDFLLKYNGGRIVPNHFKTLNNEIETDIQFFFGITSNSIYDIGANYTRLSKKISAANLIPIAIDSLGNYILISCANPTYELIYLLQHDSFAEDIFVIALNFIFFLNSLYEIKIKQTELDQAVARQDISFFNRRISNGEHVDDIKNEFGQTVAIMASLRDKVKLLKFLFQKGSKMAMTVFNASSTGSSKAVEYLLSIGLSPNERNPDENDDTALMQAAYGGHLDVVKLLVASGADTNAKDINGNSVLVKARWSNNEDIVQFLESRGAKWE